MSIGTNHTRPGEAPTYTALYTEIYVPVH